MSPMPYALWAATELGTAGPCFEVALYRSATRTIPKLREGLLQTMRFEVATMQSCVAHTYGA